MYVELHVACFCCKETCSTFYCQNQNMLLFIVVPLVHTHAMTKGLKTFLFLHQVLETISCYPENMEAKELRRILTQPHFMVGQRRSRRSIQMFSRAIV